MERMIAPMRERVLSKMTPTFSDIFRPSSTRPDDSRFRRRVMRAVDPKDRPTGVTRITLLEEDGSEKVLDITEDLHFIFAFVKVSEKETSRSRWKSSSRGTRTSAENYFTELG